MEALGGVLEFVNNAENVWAVKEELIEVIVLHVRAPR